jgi:hypothetical protein
MQTTIASGTAHTTAAATEQQSKPDVLTAVLPLTPAADDKLMQTTIASGIAHTTANATEQQSKPDVLTAVLPLTPAADDKLMQTTIASGTAHTTATEQQSKPDMIATQVTFANHPAHDVIKPSISPALPLTSASDSESAQTAIGTNNLTSQTVQPAKVNLLIPLRKNTTPENQSQTLSAAQNLPTATANRFESALDPALQQAYQVTQQQLQNSPYESSGPESSGRVRNTFNVSVAMNNSGNAENIDLTLFEQALTDVLLTAARRQGLEV